MLACGLLVGACGGSGGASPARSVALTNTTTTAATGSLAPAVSELAAATRPQIAEFPATKGRSLRQLALLIKETAHLGAGTSTYTVGQDRFAFALTDHANRFIYAPTAIYIARSANGPAQGPFLTPADSLAVARQYRSNENDGPGGLKAVYWTELHLPKSGVYDVLALTRVGSRLIGSTGEVPVALNTPIPSVGHHAPSVATDTLASEHGKLGLVTTRIPPENMHSVSFNQVLGKRPIALLFSTPALCKSRVCGPVTDIMVELQHEFGKRIVFIHQEIYIDNDPSKGLRPQLKAFGLESEPWLFMVNSKGIITARMNGVFGVNEARAALESALR